MQEDAEPSPWAAKGKPPEPHRWPLAKVLRILTAAAPGRVWLAAAMLYRGDDRRRLARLQDIAEAAGVKLLAVNDVLYDTPERRPLQDVVTCIREHFTIETAGRRLLANAERHMKSPEEMARLFRDAPEAIEETVRFFERANFSLAELRYDYPDEPVPPGKTPQQHLEDLTWEGAAKRYPGGLRDDIRQTLEKELRLIEQLNYAPYFLTVYDLVRYANSQNILCQGRGSAANSAVCFMLGITAVDPTEIDLLFERFISAERSEPPDIDVDFEHERREEVIQYVYDRYTRDRAGIAATVISYRPRSAIREVGKALGLTEDVTGKLAGTVWGSWGNGISQKQIAEAGLDPRNPMIQEAVGLATQLLGAPRHLSQHVGGFVLTKGRLDETVPIGNAAMEDRTFIEWDKDDLDTLGLLKVDVLALGMLTCVRKCFDLLRLHEGIDLDLSTVPINDPEVYAMIQKADTLGVFQIESRAQMSMLPRLRPQNFYDLVIEVAIVRPGPIQGDMVHPYLKRRKNPDGVKFPSPSPEHGPKDELEQVLKRTLGVPLFQEQAMKIAMVAAKFTSEEANGLRRAMATFRRSGTIHNFFHKLVDGMVARGYERDFAERCFRQIEGFGEYGFPESHAAAFARLAYVSSWLKCHHPAAFAAALLNAQPMGFYAPAQIVRDARDHQVEVRPVDINHSHHDNTLERAADGRLALRLGFRQVDGFREEWGHAIMRARGIPVPEKPGSPPPVRGRSIGAADRVGVSERTARSVGAGGALTPTGASRHLPLSGGGKEGEGEGSHIPSLEALQRAAGLSRRALELLADADCCRSIGLDRRNALWAVRRLPDDAPLALFAAARSEELPEEEDAQLPLMPLSEHVVTDYQTLRLSLKAHPMHFLREMLRAEGARSCAETSALPDGARTRTAGVVLVRQRPGTASGVIFMTIEDESGITNAIIWPKLTERYRREIMSARLILIEGQVQRSPEGVVHLVASRLADRSHELVRLSERPVKRFPLSNADEVVHNPNPDRVHKHPRNVRIIPKSRDFH
ncbi:MAG: error-prone DNA polymerase [Bauldia sp.]|nr:error-prone DNA polymerase [Bauldia sp.]